MNTTPGVYLVYSMLGDASGLGSGVVGFVDEAGLLNEI